MRLLRKIDKLNITIGGLCSYLSIILVFNIFLSVVQRYVFNHNYIWQSELSEVLSSIIFLGCVGYTLYFNSHVRVDIAYEKFSSRLRAWVNATGSIFLIFPMCFAIIYFSLDFVSSSWKIFEASPEYSGLQGIFLFKSLIIGFAILLFFSGVSVILNSIKALRLKQVKK